MNRIFILGLMAFLSSCVANKQVTIVKEKIAFENERGKKKIGSRLTVTSTLNCSADTIWKAFEKTHFWLYILDPQARLVPIKESPVPTQWKLQETYVFQLIMNGFIPYGKHYLVFEEINAENYFLQTREYGLSVPHWDNYFEIVPISDSTCMIKDVLETQAGGLNWYVTPYAKNLLKGKHKRLAEFSQKK